MTNEELKAKIEALNSMDEAYALAKECGFTGTMEEFKAACTKSAGDNEQMDMDAMDNVAGGGVFDSPVMPYWVYQSLSEQSKMTEGSERSGLEVYIGPNAME